MYAESIRPGSVVKVAQSRGRAMRVDSRPKSIRRGLVPEGLNESSPARSAGKWCKKRGPSRQGRWKCFGSWSSRMQLHQRERPSIVPPGRVVFLNATPALRTGLLSLSPSGTTSLRAYPSCYVDAPAQPRNSFIDGLAPIPQGGENLQDFICTWSPHELNEDGLLMRIDPCHESIVRFASEQD
jgi:hypothetical protein